MKTKSLRHSWSIGIYRLQAPLIGGKSDGKLLAAAEDVYLIQSLAHAGDN